MNNLQTATNKLREWQAIEGGAVFEIGRILKEVKEKDLARGNWTSWLESVGYNPRTAQRYMQVYERFHALPGADSVSISKLTELLSLPVDVDAKPFVDKAKTESVREIREKVREVIGKTEPKEKPAPRIEKSSTSSYVKKLITTLNNLIPELADGIEGDEDNVSLSKLLSIAKESHEVQQKLLYLSDVSIDVKYLIEIARLTPNRDLEEIKTILTEISTNSKGFFDLYWADVSVLDSFEEMKTVLLEILGKLEEFSKKSKEWEESWENKRGRSEGFDAFRESTGISAAKILGISENATPEEAKKRYRQLMKLLHPDQGGDAQLFDVIKKAYDSLYNSGSLSA